MSVRNNSLGILLYATISTTFISDAGLGGGGACASALANLPRRTPIALFIILRYC